MHYYSIIAPLKDNDEIEYFGWAEFHTPGHQLGVVGDVACLRCSHMPTYTHLGTHFWVVANGLGGRMKGSQMEKSGTSC